MYNTKRDNHGVPDRPVYWGGRRERTSSVPTNKEIVTPQLAVWWVSPRYTVVWPELRAGRDDEFSLAVGVFLFDRTFLLDSTHIKFVIRVFAPSTLY